MVDHSLLFLYIFQEETSKSIKQKPLEFKETPSRVVKAVSKTTLTCSAYGNPSEMQGSFYDFNGKIPYSVTKTSNLFTIEATVNIQDNIDVRYDMVKERSNS